MSPIKFKEQNRILQKPLGMTKEECSPLPVFADGQQSISCWQATWWERIKFLFSGRVWVCVLSGKTQPPIWADIKYPFSTEDK